MHIALLHRIARVGTPYVVANEREIDIVRVLTLGGHVKALIPPVPGPGAKEKQLPAIVTDITPLGHWILRSLSPRRRGLGGDGRLGGRTRVPARRRGYGSRILKPLARVLMALARPASKDSRRSQHIVTILRVLTKATKPKVPTPERWPS